MTHLFGYRATLVLHDSRGNTLELDEFVVPPRKSNQWRGELDVDQILDAVVEAQTEGRLW